MTIYDADYALELEAQQEAVKEPIAEVQEQVSKPVEEPVETQEEAQIPEETSEEINWKAARAKQKEIEEELARIREENAFLKGKAERSNPFEKEETDVLKEVEDDDYMSKAQVQKYIESIQQKNKAELSALKFETQESVMRSQYNDYDEVIKNFFIPLVNENAYFGEKARASVNPALYAYQIGKGRMMEERLSQPETPRVNKDAERVIANSRKPGTLSSARGGQPKISQADYYATMSQTDFEKLVASNLDQT